MKTAALLCLLVAPAARADAQWTVHAHVKYQFSLQHFPPATFGADAIAPTPLDQTLDGRLNVTYRRGRIDVTLNGQLFLLAGDTVAAARSGAAGTDGAYLLGPPGLDDASQWLDLTARTWMGDRAELIARLDRASIGYTGDRLVVRLGRQALSWGNGLVFQVLDLFNPFPPNVLDTDYKPGRDMLTTQWRLPGGDLQAIVVPGRPQGGGALAADASSVAAKWHHTAGSVDVDALAARHDGDVVVGGGASAGLAGGVWRIDLSHTRVNADGVTSLVANYDRAWSPGGRTLYAFAEYFRNGFGLAEGGGSAAVLDPALLARLQRGELFSLGRHEFASGVRFDWTPLVTVSPTALVNLTDGSVYALAQVEYDWRQRSDALYRRAGGPGAARVRVRRHRDPGLRRRSGARHPGVAPARAVLLTDGRCRVG